MNRTRDAERLADTIVAAHPDLTPEALATFARTGMLDWALAAAQAGTGLPDTATRLLTAANLQSRPARHLAVAR